MSDKIIKLKPNQKNIKLLTQLMPKRGENHLIRITGETVLSKVDVYHHPFIGGLEDQCHLFSNQVTDFVFSPVSTTKTAKKLSDYFYRIDDDTSGAMYLNELCQSDEDIFERDDMLIYVISKAHRCSWPMGFMAIKREVLYEDLPETEFLEYILKPEYFYVASKYRGRALTACLFTAMLPEIIDDVKHYIGICQAHDFKLTVSTSHKGNPTSEEADAVLTHVIDDGLARVLYMDDPSAQAAHFGMAFEFAPNTEVSGPVPVLDF